MQKIIVDIIDDHQMIISGLKEMIKGFNTIQLGNTYNSGIALLEGLQKQQPDVLLLDIQMPGVNGDELAALISKSYPNIKMLALTGFNTLDHVNLMLEKGVHGYLLKNSDEHRLREAIESVYRDEQYIEPSLRDKINNARYGTAKRLKPALSKREKDILLLMLDELTNQQIAEKLNISLRTVEFHRMSLIQKLDAKNVIGMVRKAYELGLVTKNPKI